jgi:hypothetical protein
LFGFSGSPGSFDNLMLPSLEAGLTWDTGKLSLDGTICVILSWPSAPQFFNPQVLNSSNFVMNVTGVTNTGQFCVLTQTDLAEPVANWATLSTNTFDGNGALNVTNLVNPAEPQRFIRTVKP